MYGKDFFVKGTVKGKEGKTQKAFVYIPSLMHTEKLPVSVLKPYEEVEEEAECK